MRLAIDLDAVALDGLERLEGALDAVAGLTAGEPHTQYAVQYESEKTDHRMGANAIRQAMMDGRDIEGALQCPEAALDIGQGAIARNDGNRSFEDVIPVVSRTA